MSREVRALEVSKILGKMNAAIKAITIASLFYRQLQAELQRALMNSCQDYGMILYLSDEAKEELWWWATHFRNWNGHSLIAKKPNVSLETDASRTEWGAVCQGTRTGGPWSREEQRLHINCLELLEHSWPAEDGQHITVAYINKTGGTVSPALNKLNKEFWRGTSPYKHNIWQGS